MYKLTLGLLLCISFDSAFSTEALDNKAIAMNNIESAFITPASETFTAKAAMNKVQWPEDLSVQIDNTGHFIFTSKHEISISKIVMSVDDTTVANRVNIMVKPKVEAHYFFADVKIPEILNKLASGYKVVGVRQNVSVNDFPGFHIYKYKIIHVTVDWTSKQDYEQSTNDFMLMMAK